MSISGKVTTPQTAMTDIAEMGSLDLEVAADVAILQEFFENRDRVMAQLFGRTLRRSPLRDELVRQIILQFAQQKRRRVAYYTQVCAFLATGPSVRSELDLLADLGLVKLFIDPADGRATQVAPTNKLVTFYNDQMPRLRTQVLELLRE